MFIKHIVYILKKLFNLKTFNFKTKCVDFIEDYIWSPYYWLYIYYGLQTLTREMTMIFTNQKIVIKQTNGISNFNNLLYRTRLFY